MKRYEFTPPPEPETLVTLRRTLMDARYPATYAVSRDTLEAVEDYLVLYQAASRVAWEDAGKPDDWPYSLATLYRGREHEDSVMFKAVELYVPKAVPA